MSYFSVIEDEADIFIQDVLEGNVIARWRKGMSQHFFDWDYDKKFEDFIFDFVDSSDIIQKNKYECYHDCVKQFERLKRGMICAFFIKSVLKEIDLRLIRFEEG